MHRLCILAILCIVSECVIAKQCRAQNILDACLRMQHLQFKSCDFDAWQCKCHGQKKILTCYDNCPDLEERTLQEMQVQVFCAPLNDKELNSEIIDRMTRPAKVVAEDQPTAHPAAKKADPAPAPAPAPAPKPTSDDDWSKGARDKSNSNFSLVNDNAAAISKQTVSFGQAAVALIIAALI